MIQTSLNSYKLNIIIKGEFPEALKHLFRSKFAKDIVCHDETDTAMHLQSSLRLSDLLNSLNRKGPASSKFDLSMGPDQGACMVSPPAYKHSVETSC